MFGLLASYRDVLFPKAGGDGPRQISWKYLVLTVLIPVGFGWLAWGHLTLRNAEVVAASFGVLGGLLFAHAVFVFQLRITYDARGIEPADAGAEDQEDTRVRPLIDEMFTSVLYSSFVALLLTLLAGAVAAFQVQGSSVPKIVTVAIVVVGTHLIGCIWHVISATRTAYATLRLHDSED